MVNLRSDLIQDKYDVEPKNIIIFDIETTGLNPFKEKIIELSFTKLKNNTGNTILINPEMNISDESTEIHKITNEMVEDENTFEEIIDDLEKDLLCKSNGEPIYLIAHNCFCFDELMLKQEYERINRKMPEQFIFLDTLPIVRALIKDIENHKQPTLKEYFNINEISEEHAHTAMGDVLVLAEIWENLKKIQEENELIEISLNHKKKMNFGAHRNKLICDIPDSYINWMISQNMILSKDNDKVDKNKSLSGYYNHNIFLDNNEYYRNKFK